MNSIFPKYTCADSRKVAAGFAARLHAWCRWALLALAIALLVYLEAGCAVQAAATPPGEIVQSSLVGGGPAFIYIAPEGSGDLPGAAALDGREGTIHVAGGRIGIVVPIPTGEAKE